MLSCRYHLERNLQDKDAALRVDETTSRLTPTAPPTDIIPEQSIDPRYVITFPCVLLPQGDPPRGLRDLPLASDVVSSGL